MGVWWLRLRQGKRDKDVLDRVVARVAPELGEKCLDVATGTGWTARLLKAHGADVTGVDIGVGVIEAAKKLAPDIDFRLGDAEELDFPDSGFDVVTSTFGVMFVARPEDARTTKNVWKCPKCNPPAPQLCRIRTPRILNPALSLMRSPRQVFVVLALDCKTSPCSILDETSQAGYRCFVTVSEFKQYVQTEILVQEAA
jgi:SAM-dependent methyltransferase